MRMPEIPKPYTVRFTRLAPRRLDSDNLIMAFKKIRDELSDSLNPDNLHYYVDKKGKVKQLKGRNDDDPEVTWEYAQETSKSYAIRIEIF